MLKTPEPLKILKILEHYGEIKGKVTLHKIVYTLQTKHGFDLGYKFVNYSFGPYSKDLEDDLKLLQSLGLIEEKQSGSDYVVKITSKGKKASSSLPPLTSNWERSPKW